MKELSIEEKAKAYDKVREKIAVRFGTNVAEEIFSKFEESEDERIRKGLINYFNHHKNGINIFYGIKGDDILAWLEKQGEQKVNYTTLVETGDGGINALVTRELSTNDYDEQKVADIVEPKFKVGDWIIFNGLTLYINEVVEGYYRTISIGGIPNSYDWDIDNVARLWTIQDAKDGDVLAGNKEKLYCSRRCRTLG